MSIFLGLQDLSILQPRDQGLWHPTHMTLHGDRPTLHCHMYLLSLGLRNEGRH